MSNFNKIQRLVDDFEQEKFDQLSSLEKAIVLYLKDSQIEDSLFLQARREPDYLDQARELIHHPRLQNLLAPTLHDKLNFFQQDPTIEFISMEDVSDKEAVSFVKEKYSVDKITGKYSVKQQRVDLNVPALDLLEQFFKKTLSIDISDVTLEILEDTDSEFIEIELVAQDGFISVVEIQEKRMNLSFWKNSSNKVSSALTMTSLAFALSLTACAKATYKTHNNPTPANPGVTVPGITNPGDSISYEDLVFANYDEGSGEAKVQMSEDARLTLPEQITQFTFSRDSEEYNIDTLLVYASISGTPICMYHFDGVKFVATGECEISLLTGESLIVRGIPLNQSVTMQTQIQSL